MSRAWARLGRPLGELGLVGAIYSAVALVVTWPLLLQLGQRVIGSHRGDLWFHLWGLWWMKASLLGEGRFPVHTDMVNYPEGGTLLLIDPLNGLLSVPLQLILPLSTSYNLTVLLDLLLAALGAYLLVRTLLRHAAAAAGEPAPVSVVSLPALVSGLIFGFSPHLVGAIESGLTETFLVGLMAFYLLALLRALRERSLAWGVAAGLLMFVNLFANAYYGVFCGLLSLLCLAWMLLAERRALLGWRNLATLAAAGVCFALPALPYLRVLLGGYSAPDALIRRAPEPGRIEDVIKVHAFVADLQSFFLTRATGLRADAYHTNVSYLGYAALALLLLGLLLGRHRQRLLWLVIFLVFFVLSWGPVLKVGGRFVAQGEGYVALPFFYVFTRTPYLSLVSHPYRLTAVTMLPMAVLAGFFLDRVRAWAPWRGLLPLVCLLAGGAVLAETLALAPVRIPISSSDAAVPSFYRQLGEDPDDYGIIVVPLCFSGTDQRREYYYHQALHHKRLPYVVDQGVTRYLRDNAFTAHLYYLEWRADPELVRPYQGKRSVDEASLAQIPAGLEQLVQDDFRLLVLDESWFVPSQQRAISGIKAFLDEQLGEPRSSGPGFWVYELTAPAE